MHEEREGRGEGGGEREDTVAVQYKRARVHACMHIHDILRVSKYCTKVKGDLFRVNV